MGDQLRPTWDHYFMAIARIIAMRSSCDRLHAGAVLVKNNRIIATGYNGAPPGLPQCDSPAGHLLEEGHCVRTIHGEHNAILQAARLPGSSTEGSVLYTLYNPCIHCAKYVVAAGVRRAVIGKIYRGEAALEYIKGAGVEVEMYQEDPAFNALVRTLFADTIKEVHANEGDVTLV